MDLHTFENSLHALAHDVPALKREIADKLMFRIGKDPLTAQPTDWLHAAAYVVRDHLVGRWMRTTRAHYAQDAKRVYYLSMEFLMGRTFGNALLALGLMAPMRQALAELDVNMDVLAALEPDAALGNGGLGRLAACFLDSMATLGVPGMGYGIRYDYGMFRQQIEDGQQVEAPDYWLTQGNPWEFARPEATWRVRFGGRLEEDAGGRVRWVDTEDVLAQAYDSIVPGWDTEATNTLRLWSARATEEMNLGAFNQGNYFGAVERKNASENVSRVLYPDDSTESGRELRLRQEYFFVSASVQDLIHRYRINHSDFSQLADKVAIHLNDTHPVLAVPELMRVLVDEHGLDWDAAWAQTQRVFSYTNHTLMHEALETWPVQMLARVLPRHLRIVFDINAALLKALAARGADGELLRRVSLIDEAGERRVRMAYLAVVASHSVNGVSALHSQLMRESIFADFARLWPERFNNKTNGVTPRRWLAHANPALAALLDARIGRGWRRDLTELARLRSQVDDPTLLAALRRIKRHNKERLVQHVRQQLGVALDGDALFDVQVKRIHEYKRQLLNVLHVITRYRRMLAQPEAPWVPRVVVFAGKAASAYHMAKGIIRLIHDVAAVVNADARLNGRLKVVFIPNYSVSEAEVIIPAADLSEQISTAGTEASGTGNMKFALNGALTIGTLDGANVEMAEHIGAEHLFLFGLSAPQVTALRESGWQPRSALAREPELAAVLETLRDGTWSPTEPGRHQALHDALVNWGDHYLLLADWRAYVDTQARVDALYQSPDAWARCTALNIAGMGHFSADRTIAEYSREIWRL